MNYTLQISLKIDYDSDALQALSKAVDSDVRYLDKLLDTLPQLISETTWPESQQGEFLAFVVRDVHEFGCALRAEIQTQRWSVVGSLMRPLQERSEYILAGAIDAGFRHEFLGHLCTRVEENFAGKHRGLIESARGIIRRWEMEIRGLDELLKISLDLNKLGSELLHHGIGLTEASSQNSDVSRGLLIMACGRVKLALSNVLLALQLVGAHNTEAWQRASVVVLES